MGSEPHSIYAGDSFHSCLFPIISLQFHQQNGTLNRIQTAVAADFPTNVFISGDLPLLAQTSQTVCQSVTVSEYRSPISVAAQGFGWKKGGNR